MEKSTHKQLNLAHKVDFERCMMMIIMMMANKDRPGGGSCDRFMAMAMAMAMRNLCRNCDCDGPRKLVKSMTSSQSMSQCIAHVCLFMLPLLSLPRKPLGIPFPTFTQSYSPHILPTPSLNTSSTRYQSFDASQPCVQLDPSVCDYRSHFGIRPRKTILYTAKSTIVFT